MLKQILFGALISTSAIVLAPALVKEQSNKINTNLITPQDAVNNEMVYNVMQSLLAPKVTNGESLRQGKNVSIALPLLWNTIDSVKGQAKSQVEVVPKVGPELVKLVADIKESDLKLVDDNAILHVGDNIFDLILVIDGQDFQLTMKMSGVSS